MPSIVALIPARAGSKRCPGKNTRLLGGKPLIQWTIEAAKASTIFNRICICSDDPAVNDIGRRMGETLIPRNEVADDEPDFLWIDRAIDRLAVTGDRYDAFAILRPTSPFRTAETIRRAWGQLQASEAHSLRAVQPVSEHPGKMWQLDSGYMRPLFGRGWPLRHMAPLMTSDDRPWHSLPTQTLPSVYVQNASLEMAWSYVIPAFGTISGTKVLPFFTEGYEGFDINTEEDFTRAEQIAASLTHV